MSINFQKLKQIFIKYNSEIVIILLFLITVICVAKVNYDNGKIEMCNNLNRFYTIEGNCKSCLELGGIETSDGGCMFFKTNIFGLKENYTIYPDPDNR